MLAARDQENLVYSHQTNAVSKPLNHGIRGLQPKTPGQRAPKTPFKPSFNDENNATKFGGQKTGLKALGKGDENRVQPKKKDGKLDINAFVTPMGPRTRAPLGMKTTNAKARAFQTPAPLQQTAKPERTLKRPSTARKSIKSKIRVAPSEPVETDLLSKDPDSDVPDIEYCPPPPVELPDPPEDITYDENLPYLRGSNLCSGYAEVYDIPRDEHGVSLREQKEEEAHARNLQAIEDNFRQEMVKPWPMEDEGDIVDTMIASGPVKIPTGGSKVDTIKAKGAVSALSSQPQKKLPSAATKNTASSMQKKKASFSVLATKKSSVQPTNPSSMRHNAAVAASRTTIGYSKGRNVSSNLPEKTAQGSRVTSGKVDQSQVHPLRFRELHGEPPPGSKMWDRFMEHGLSEDEIEDGEQDLANEWWGTDILSEEEEEIFQLPMLEEM